MHWQTVVVDLVVAVAAIYAAWSLMPGSIRKVLLSAFRHRLAPQPLRIWAANATAKSGCGGTCDSCSAEAVNSPKPLVFQSRRRS